MPRYYYPITPVLKFKEPEGRGSCYQQFASPAPHGTGQNRFVVIFDEDVDFRICPRLDAFFKLAAPDVPEILVAAERKGSLTLILKGNLPESIDIASLPSQLAAMSTDGDNWLVEIFTDQQYAEFASHLSHPPLKPQSYMEAITWKA